MKLFLNGIRIFTLIQTFLSIALYIGISNGAVVICYAQFPEPQPLFLYISIAGIALSFLTFVLSLGKAEKKSDKGFVPDFD